jgi:uncharacterized protein YkwD
MAAALMLAAAATGGAAASADQAATARATDIETALLTQMNRVRVAHGRVPLRPIATLQRPARAQSAYLVGLGILDHNGRDGSPFWTRLVVAGFPTGRTLGENLAMVPGCDPAAARQTVRMWLASRGHRANLLNPRYRWVGAGVASSADCSSTVLTADYGS